MKSDLINSTFEGAPLSGISFPNSPDASPVLEVDRESGSAYLRLVADAEITATYEITDKINVDVDRNRVVVGLELLDLSIVELTDEMVSGVAPIDPAS